MKKLFILFFFLFAFSFANAQDFKGKVFLINSDGQKEPAGFATIVCIENGQVAEADIDSNFTFKRVKLDKATFYATFIGYTKDTVVVNIPHEYHEFNLKDENELNALSFKNNSCTYRGDYCCRFV